MSKNKELSGRLFGLIGFPLSHSFSKGYFSEKFSQEGLKDCAYKNFPIEDINLFPGLIRENDNLLGLNVTIPYKESVIPFLTSLSDDAKEIGAVNTIKIIRKKGEIITKGYNTDVFGFNQTLLRHNIQVKGSCLVLGTGGASKAVEWVLKQYGARVVFASRNKGQEGVLTYDELNHISLQEFSVVINTTPLGMYPKIDQCPDIPYGSADSHTTFIDLIYNPSETLFMQRATAIGAKAVNGLLMLEQQAEKAWKSGIPDFL